MPTKKKDENNDDAESINSSSNGSSSLKNSRVTRKSKTSLRNAANDDTSKQTQSQIASEIIELIKNYRIEGDSKLIADSFFKLPPKRTNPEYYNVVTEPIDLNRIQQRLKSNEYEENFQQFDKDILLLISNAKLFYKKNMPEHKDILLIQEFYESEKKKRSIDGLCLSQVKADKENGNETVQDSDDDDAEEEDDEQDSFNDDEMKIEESSDKMNDSTSNLDKSTKSTRNSRNKSAKGKQQTNKLPANENGSVNDSQVERTTRNKSVSKPDLSVYLEDYFDMICSYQDETQRYLANIFYLLPSATDYPDYYDIIKKPIDLKEIAKRIYNNYKSLKQMESDLMLMTDNAKRYNDPKSSIYKDANKLKKKAKDFCKELGELMRQGKLYQSTKNRDKKQTLIQEISQMGFQELNEMITNKINNSSNTIENENEAEDEEDDDEDDDDDEEEDEDEDEDEEVNSSSQVETTAKPRKSRKSSEDAVSKSPNKNSLIKVMWSIFDYLKDFKHNNQAIMEPFIRLPSKRFYPDYFEEIKTPISLNKIKRNLNQRSYKSIRELVSDFELMFKNAMQYNLEESLIYQDAKRLLNALHVKSSELSLIIDNTYTNGRNSSPNTPSKKQQQKRSINVVEHNIKRLFKLLMDYCGGEEEATCNKQPGAAANVVIPGGRAHNKIILSQNFLELPSREQYPDYYEKIKDPIDFNTIKKKIESNGYSSESDMVNDCLRVLQNAKLYFSNETSQMYKDATKLQAYLNNRYQLFLSRNNLDSIEDTPVKITATSSITTLPKFSDVKEKIIYLYNYINDYTLDQRELAYPFRHLPSRTEYPDYYNIIKKPIDMTKIWHKINQHNHTSNYSTLDDMCFDFAQMFENACIYNEPNSTIYKDALTMQRALFTKRDEIINAELTVNQSKINANDIANLESLPVDFISNEIHELIENLFDSCMQYQDLEGRVLSEAFIDLYSLFDKKLKEVPDSSEIKPILTFEMIRTKIKQRLYKRLDIFQDDMFEIFNQVRKESYLETIASNANLEVNKYKIHRYSQFYKDAYELQRYFIQKRDELCRNGDLLQSGALSYKLSSLDAQISAILGSNTSSFDEAEALLIESHFKSLESKLENKLTDSSNSQYNLGGFYYVDRDLIKTSLANKSQFNFDSSRNKTDKLIVCLLASNQSQTKLVVQLYLKPTDDDFIEFEASKTHKFFNKEVFKSDVYALIELDGSEDSKLKPCLVFGVKDYIANEPKLVDEANENVKQEPKDAGADEEMEVDENDGKPVINLSKDDVFVCESLYSTCFRYFRKLINKKWSPLAFISSNSVVPQQKFNIKLVKRSIPLLLSRSYLNEHIIEALKKEIDSKLEQLNPSNLFPISVNRATVQYDSPPTALMAALAAKEKDPDELEPATPHSNSIEDDTELMKTAKYYEQLVFNENETYKIGDYVYVKYQPLSTNTKKTETDHSQKLPLIVRIDRLWSVMVTNSYQTQPVKSYYLRGPLFLRPVEIFHEPTRLFYRNEVFKEISREITTSLDQIVFSNNHTNNKKCVVMNTKKFVSSRLTDIDERDVYVCETKYSLHNKTFRKFTKGLRKFELSLKCSEDEIYFLKRELQLRKHLSPLLVNLNINYDESTEYVNNNETNFENGDSTLNGNQNDDYWSDLMREDDNSSQSFTQNDNTMDSSINVSASPAVKLTKNIIASKTLEELNSTSNGVIYHKIGGKIRKMREKKSGYNIFSKEFRKQLRDTKSSLSFVDMSKEVGNRWRALTDKQRADYEEKARIATIKEARLRAAQQELQQKQQQQQQQPQQPVALSPVSQSQQINPHLQNNLASPHHTNHINHILAQQSVQNQQYQIVTTGNAQNGYTNSNGSIYISANSMQSNNGQPLIIQQTQNGLITKQTPLILYQNQQQGGYVTSLQQQQQQVIMPPVAEQQPVVQQPDTPKTVQHKDAYVKYIANLRKQQQINQSGSYNTILQSAMLPADWYNSLDIRASSIKENKVMPAPTSWIENCYSAEVLEHLLTLRYHLLNDAINVKRDDSITDETDSSKPLANECMETDV